MLLADLNYQGMGSMALYSHCFNSSRKGNLFLLDPSGLLPFISGNVSKEEKYRLWLNERYQDACEKLQELISDSSPNIQVSCGLSFLKKLKPKFLFDLSHILI